MKCLLTALTSLFFISLSAQTGTVSGKIIDSASKKGLALVTVTVFRAKDTSIVTYRLSTESGEYKIPGLPMNIPLRLMATYSGYDALRKDFILTEKEPAVNFGEIGLTGTSRQLDEVIVVAERPPVVIKKDTIEFNASAFKTLPSALLEDLLKKLPGVMVDDNGNITINGQKVNRLLVDGKRFFGDNPQMATRNLPSNMIDKVQVMDDKEEIDFNNDGDLSKIGKVVNITLKKAIKKAVFGRVLAGLGSDERYETAAILNTFRDTLQLSLLGFANNINRSSFSTKDITQLGGFSRSGWGTINGNGNAAGQQGFTVDGFSLGGTGSGLARANGLGFNLNHSPSDKVNFSFNYMFGNTHNDLEQTINTQRFFEDTVVTARTLTTKTSGGRTHNLASSGGWKPDSLTNMTIRLSYAHADQWSEAPSVITTTNNKIGAVNNGTGVLTTNGFSDSYSEVFMFSRRSAKVKARNLSITQVLTYNTNPLSSITENLNSYQYPVFSNLVFQQLRATNTPTTNGYLFVNYSTPLSSRLTLRLNPSLTYQKNQQDVITYGKYLASGNYDSLNVSLTSNLAREMTRGQAGGVLSYRINNVNLNAGVGWLQQWINNSFTGGAGSRLYYSNVLLNLSVNWKRFSVGFSQDVNAPGINFLLPTPDNSNPFFIVYGNPGLAPAKRNNINFNGNIIDARKNINFYFSGQSAITDDAVIQAIELGSNGIQQNKPVNVRGVWSNYFNMGFSKQYKNAKQLNVTVSGGTDFSLNRTPIRFNNEDSRLTGLSIGGNVGVALNWNDLIEFSPRYSINSNQSHYTSNAFNSANIIQQVLQGEFIVRMPKKIVWETNMYYRHLNQVAPGLPKASVYWNAAVTLLMFKQDKGQLRLAVYDILNSNTSVVRFINTNAITDNRTNVLQRYFMLTYTYNIRSFGGQTTKVGGNKSLWNF
ncbi:outer membrane beta-barrel protein [Sediminibacterium ginsengisoli]|uniref:Carboxypeptidase regulatory-like domain-containing protein n=1 Tax=Sediminibacterium ginsengisoli TaxID=413434 RepID=A0A1T4K0P2_9BACT|nr:outer membrane beta-barrel protein [Sediminibacterium ginsengisoli]SJZ35983.1 Carboxypeptidase regulatory-like domain-containing protein [Sediminibacterium ginsengisoli]